MATPKKKPGNRLNASERRQVTKSNKAIKRRRDITAGAKQGGLWADSSGLGDSLRDLDKVNAKTGMSAAEQAREDSRGTGFDLVRTNADAARDEEVAGKDLGTRSPVARQFRGHGGAVFRDADSRNKHNKRFINDMMRVGAPIPESMHRELEAHQQMFETTKDPAKREDSRKRIGRMLQAGAINPSKFPNGTACQTPNCPNSTKDDVVCSTCLGGAKGSRTEGKKTTGTKMQTADVAGAGYRDKPQRAPKDLTKTKSTKPRKAA